jgi:carboxyl-terminal processing protease
MKTNVKYLPILIGATLALGILMGGWLNAIIFVENSSKTKINKLIDFIDNEYVDNINTDSIVNITVDNILSHLDPHSVYISPSEQTQVAESMKGDFVGIGVNFYMYKDSVAIIALRMVLRLKREYKQGIESYMLIEQNYLDVSYLVIAFF